MTSAGTDTEWMIVSSVAPAFIIASDVGDEPLERVAMSSSTVAMRSRPAIGRPWAGTSSSGPCAIISRSAAAHSTG